ncbi:MAG: S1 RNA-binding domain-containing protein [Acidobacteria bacterium]|nr:S1 RNA-binding domain-containing protein [Acidobacteriota bacterium]
MKKQRKSRHDDHHKRELSDDSFAQLMEESFKPARTMQIGDEIQATVIGFDNENIFLDLGTRLDGILKRRDLSEKENKKITEGQTLTVYVTGKGEGIWMCSNRIGGGDTRGEDTQYNTVLTALEDAYNRNIPVEGKITGISKGGFEVQVMGMQAFCPLSQIDKHYCDNPDAHLNKIYTFEIIEFKEEGPNIVLSRRELLAHEEKKRAELLWQKVEEGAVYQGTVAAVREFGAFVDIGGIEGLLHISEIAYERINNAADVLSVGQKLDVVIKNIDRPNRKLSLSAKSLLVDPWNDAVKKLTIGGEYQGKVVRMKTYGAFVELFPGVDGMVHVSRLGTDRRHQHPKEVLNIGDTVTVRVIEIDEQNRKISLTMEKEEPNFSADLERLNKEQEKVAKSTPSKISHAVDEAINKEQ